MEAKGWWVGVGGLLLVVVEGGGLKIAAAITCGPTSSRENRDFFPGAVTPGGLVQWDGCQTPAWSPSWASAPLPQPATDGSHALFLQQNIPCWTNGSRRSGAFTWRLIAYYLLMVRSGIRLSGAAENIICKSTVSNYTVLTGVQKKWYIYICMYITVCQWTWDAVMVFGCSSV